MCLIGRCHRVWLQYLLFFDVLVIVVVTFIIPFAVLCILWQPIDSLLLSSGFLVVAHISIVTVFCYAFFYYVSMIFVSEGIFNVPTHACVMCMCLCLSRAS